MEFEQPELAEALRELAIERDASFADRRIAYVDYDAAGRIERINWPVELGAMPQQADMNTRMGTIRQRRSQDEAQSQAALQRLAQRT